MAITSYQKLPNGIIPVGSDPVMLEMTEATLSGKTNYRVEISFHGYKNLPVLEARPDAQLRIKVDIAPLLRSVLKTNLDVTDRFRLTHIIFQAKWDASFDAAVSLSFNPIYFYSGSNSFFYNRPKVFIGNSYAQNQKFLYGPSKFYANTARNHYWEFIQKVTDTVTWTTTGANMVQEDYSSFSRQVGAAWDHQVYSTQSYVNSCYAEWTPVSGNTMCGLNSDPTLNASYTSIDYALQLYPYASDATGRWGAYAYENGAGVFLTSLDPNPVIPHRFRIEYDGVNVSYYVNGILLRQIARAVGAALYFDSSFFGVETWYNKTFYSKISEVEFGPLVKWTLSANMSKVTQREFKKTSGTSAYDEQFYSTESYTTNVFVKGNPCIDVSAAGAATAAGAIGLNSDPTLNANYTSIDYAFVYDAALSRIDIYENGVFISTAISNLSIYELEKVTCAVVYDGVNVNYYIHYPRALNLNIRGWVLARSVARAVGAALFADSSCYNSASGWTNVEFSQIPTMNRVSVGGITISDQTFLGNKVEFYQYTWNGFVAGDVLAVKQLGTLQTLASLPVEIRPECANPVFLRWINDLGGLQEWLFDTNQDVQHRQFSAYKHLIKSCFAVSVPVDVWQSLAELSKNNIEIGDGKVGMYTIDATSELSPYAGPVFPVVINETSPGTRNKNVGHYITIYVRYPQINNTLC